MKKKMRSGDHKYLIDVNDTHLIFKLVPEFKDEYVELNLRGRLILGVHGNKSHVNS